MTSSLQRHDTHVALTVLRAQTPICTTHGHIYTDTVINSNNTYELPLNRRHQKPSHTTMTSMQQAGGDVEPTLGSSEAWSQYDTTNATSRRRWAAYIGAIQFNALSSVVLIAGMAPEGLHLRLVHRRGVVHLQSQHGEQATADSCFLCALHTRPGRTDHVWHVCLPQCLLMHPCH